MKALFVHDHKFSIDENGNVLSHLMDGSLWERYLEHCDTLRVIGRGISVSSSSSRIGGLRPAGADNVSFELLRCETDPKTGETPLGFKGKYNAVKKAVSESDAVIARLPSIFGYMACREAKKQGKRLAVEVVACAWDSNHYHMRLKNRAMALPSLMVMKHCVKRADAAIYVTDEYLQRIYPCKGDCAVASNVIVQIPDEQVLQDRLNRIEARQSTDRLVFGLIGSLDVGFKGHETAIKALAAAKSDIPDFELRFIGDGSFDRWQSLATEQGIGDRVFYDGLKKSGGDVIDWLDSLDILLIPSLQEGLPRALIEAMSRGLPALGAITGGIPQLLSENYLHKKKDYIRLSEHIKRLSGDKKEMKECAEKNFNAVRRFDRQLLKQQRSEFWGGFFGSVKEAQRQTANR